MSLFDDDREWDLFFVCAWLALGCLALGVVLS